MSEYKTNKTDLAEALTGGNPELANDIVAWMQQSAKPAAGGVQPLDDDGTIIITHPK